MRAYRVASLAGLLLLAGCATRPIDSPVSVSTPAGWANSVSPVAQAQAIDEHWWMRLGDPAIDRLVDAALQDNPTLAQALARVDQARATLAVGRAAQIPRVDVSGSASQGRQNVGTTAGAHPVDLTAASISPSVSWELDLWGRVRKTARAAQSRLDARTADAHDARLAVAAQLAGGVLRLRTCHYSLLVRSQDIASRKTELDLMEKRLSFGNVAPVEVANARANVASAETGRISQREQCTREIDALVALSGLDAATIRALLPEPPAPTKDAMVSAPAWDGGIAGIIPTAPPMQPALPATVLLAHPGVIAAEREAAARWSEIGVAEAERLPRIDLAAMLTGQWIRVLGSTLSFTTWSAGPQLSGTIFDGGAGAANVRNAEARYRESVAGLQLTVREAVQNIEDGLAAQQSAQARLQTSRDAVAAARFALTANEARWRAGAISQFELQESRRQFNSAQESAIAAARDNAVAWVDLVRLSGNGFDLTGGGPQAPAAAVQLPSFPEQSR